MGRAAYVSPGQVAKWGVEHIERKDLKKMYN
jgi:hypothetical protein